MIKQFSIFILLLFSKAINTAAQNPYVLNGNATQDNCHCYTLTQPLLFQAGSVWNKNKIDLTIPFDYFFNVYLGCIDYDGADGIVFVLQPVSTSLGSAGQGLGFGGIVPSVGVTIDTYQNFTDSDPYYDHLAIQANGDVVHFSPNNLAGPVQALAGSDNIEDCKWHVLEVSWQPSANLMQVSIDGIPRLSMQKDIITSIFKSDPLVYWGFTSATGGSVNLQQMCTSLDADFVLAPYPNTCIGTPLTFVDSSVSFGNIANWFWNFDDGTTSNLKNPPAHLYTSPGIYNVSLNVLGGEGCLSDTFKKQITVGSYPVADFNVNTSPICTNRPALFKDATILDVGTENYWYWNFGNGTTSDAQNPEPVNYAMGNYTIQFYTKTIEGCASDTAKKNFIVLQAPVIDFTTNDACTGTTIPFVAENFNDTISIEQWYWNFGDNNFSVDSAAIHIYSNADNYKAALVGKAINGCLTDTITKPVIIYGTNAYAGNDTTVLVGYPYQLHASGGLNYTWSPSIGLDNPFIADPVATLYNDITYTLTASTVLGYLTTDTLHLKVVKGPEIYVPSAFTPNGDGKNDKFKIIPAGIAEIDLFKIMNRWGEVMYSSKTLEGWDGNFRDVAQPAGTYIWIVVAKTINNSIIKKQGTLVLIR